MSEAAYTVDAKVPATNKRIRRQREKVTEDVKEAQVVLWNTE
jgi:hypothetical protein